MATKVKVWSVSILLTITLLAILASCALREEEAEVPHGQRDWSNIGATEVVHGTSDMAELAVRLGSPNAFNREGNVLMIETFEHGATPWGKTLGGDNAEIITSAVEYRTGGYSLKLDSGTGTLHYAMASTTFPYPALGKFGVELSFTFDSNVTLVDPELWAYDGKKVSVYGLRYNVASGAVQKRTGSTTWETIVEDVDLHPALGLWHWFKFVCNLNTGYYERLIINEQEYDISAEQSWITTLEETARLGFRFTVRGSSGTAGIAHLDDLIITRGEP